LKTTPHKIWAQNQENFDPIMDNFPIWQQIALERSKIRSVGNVHWKLQILH